MYVYTLVQFICSYVMYHRSEISVISWLANFKIILCEVINLHGNAGNYIITVGDPKVGIIIIV